MEFWPEFSGVFIQAHKHFSHSHMPVAGGYYLLTKGYCQSTELVGFSCSSYCLSRCIICLFTATIVSDSEEEEDIIDPKVYSLALQNGENW